MVTFLTGSQFVWVFRKVQFLGHYCFCLTLMNLIRLFLTNCLLHDDIALYKEIVSPCDQQLLQENLAKVYHWTQLWQLNLNP